MARRKPKAKQVEGFVNPFTPGVSYDDFNEAVEASGKTVDEYCEDDLTQDQLDYLKMELKSHEFNQQNTVDEEVEETTED